MKKRLLFLSIAVGMLGLNASAQLTPENFNSGTLPAGWVLINDGHTVNSAFAGSASLATALTTSAWLPVEIATAGDYSMITTSDFSPAAQANRWLITPSFTVTDANMVLQWDEWDLNSGENIQILASPTAGTTAAAFTTSLYAGPANAAGALATRQILLGSMMGETIRIAFRDSTTNNWGLVIDNVSTPILSNIDMGVTAMYYNTNVILAGSTFPITGNIHNYGLTPVTSMNLNYSVNGGTPVSTSLTGLSIGVTSTLGATTDYTYTSGTPWVAPTTPGTYILKVWADNINGSVDGNHTNDTLTTAIYVFATLQPKTVMVEEFNQASCDPCAEAAANVDSVYANNASRAILLRYHVNFPGVDHMDDETLAPFVQDMLTYYNVSGVPDAQVDGYYVYPGAAGAGTFSTDVIGELAAAQSPFTVNVTSATYDASTQKYSFSANITSSGDLPAGLTARAALSIDNITYANNQSTESIPQYVFPEVAENMFPNSGGTSLAAFTTGSSQTVALSWTKDHPWGSDEATWKYDSSLTGKIIVWVEDDNLKYVYQAGYAAVSTVFTTGVTTVNNDASMDVYPNPASKTATIALSLKASASVTVEVYNMLGQLVYSVPATNRNEGLSTSNINVSNFAAGQYSVKISIDDKVLTKQLTITK